MGPEDHPKCGSDACLVDTLGEVLGTRITELGQLLLKQHKDSIETLMKTNKGSIENLKELFSTKVAHLEDCVERLKDSVKKDLDEIFKRLREVEKEQEVSANAPAPLLKDDIYKVAEKVFEENVKKDDGIKWANEWHGRLNQAQTKIFIYILTGIAGLSGLGLAIYIGMMIKSHMG